jgi:hypothetical protein
MVNKKAQDLSIGTLILIVLGIIVLVLLILGFSMGWGNLWDKINIFGGGSSIGDVSTSCNLAVSNGNAGLYDYCQNFRKVKVNGQTEYVNCQDNRLQLTGSLNCGDTDYAKEQCKKLSSEQGSKYDDTIKVNNVACKSKGVAKGQCAGANLIQCPSINDQENCTNQDGCAWNPAPANTPGPNPTPCTGNAKACNIMLSQSACEKQKSCLWVTSS